MKEEEKGVVGFVVDEVYKDFKNTYGYIPKKKSPELKPRKANQQIELDQLMENDKSREQVYQEAMLKMLATKD